MKKRRDVTIPNPKKYKLSQRSSAVGATGDLLAPSFYPRRHEPSFRMKPKCIVGQEARKRPVVPIQVRYQYNACVGSEGSWQAP